MHTLNIIHIGLFVVGRVKSSYAVYPPCLPSSVALTWLPLVFVGNFLVTIEGQFSFVWERRVRVYINVHKNSAGSHGPVKARVAGQLASLRLSSINDDRESVDDMDSFSMIEIPLKGPPCCIAVDTQTRNIAVGIVPCTTNDLPYNLVLIYGLCCKQVAGSQLVYRLE